MPKIAVNTRTLIWGKMEGIGWFAYEVLKRMVRNHPEVEWLFYFDRPFSEDFIFSDSVTPHVIHPQARHPLLFYLWFEFGVKRALDRHQADVFYSPDGYSCVGTSVPTLPVIHDLNFEHNKENLPFIQYRYYKHFFPKFARHAARIGTVSAFSKADIASTYHIDPELIDVIPNGVREAFCPLGPDGTRIAREKWAGGAPYFIFIGALHPRKNLVRLFKSFDAFRKQKAEMGHKLLIVGEAYWWNDELKATFEAMQFKQDVILTGRLDQEDLNLALSGATALTFVPYFEGFGVPIIEAFASGTPVICSNVTSMPEVAGNAAFMVDPFDEDTITRAMIQLASDKSLREELRSKGLERVKQYNWEHSAELMWKSIEKLL